MHMTKGMLENLVAGDSVSSSSQAPSSFYQSLSDELGAPFG